jgi:hypothetical protein
MTGGLALNADPHSGSPKRRPARSGRLWPAGGQALGELHVAPVPHGGALIVGRWLTALREPERSQTAQKGTDKTDRTARIEVLSVLSVPVGRICEKSEQEPTERCVGFVGAPCGSGHEQQPFPTRPDFSPDDWWAFYDGRPALVSSTGRRQELRPKLERLLQDTAAALGACPSHT